MTPDTLRSPATSSSGARRLTSVFAALLCLPPSGWAWAGSPSAGAFDDLRGRVRNELAAGQPWQALRLAQEWLALPDISKPQRADIRRQSARIRVLLGDYAGAELDLKSALQFSPRDHDALLSLAEVMRDRPEAALRHAEKAARIARTPRQKRAAYLLSGAIRLDLGDTTGAASSVERALELASNDIEALRLMVQITRDRPSQAAAFARRAMEAAEASPLWMRGAAFRLGAQLWLEIKDHAQAAASLGRALELDPDDAEALEALVEIKRLKPDLTLVLGSASPGEARTDREAEMEAAALRSLTSAPEDLESLRRMIEIARDQKRVQETSDFADRFMEAVPRAPAWQQRAAYCLLARTWMRLGEWAKAEASLGQALDLDWNSLETGLLLHRLAAERPGAPEGAEMARGAYMTIAKSRLELGDASGAEAGLGRALKAFPGHSPLLQMMARVKLAQRRPREALSYARRALAAAPEEPGSHVSSQAPFSSWAADQAQLTIRNIDAQARAKSDRRKERREAARLMAEVEEAVRREEN